MAQSLITPLEVDEARVTTVVDNTIDVLMASSEVAERYILGPKWLPIVSALPNPLERQRAIAEPRLFTTAPIRGILHNPLYTGRVRHKDQLLPGVHEALVSTSIFDAVQTTMKKNSGRSETLHPRPEREYLLKGLIRCAHCGLPKSRTQLHKGTASGLNGSSPSGDPSAWGAPWLGNNSTPLTSLVLPILMPPRRCSGPSSRGRRLNNI